LNPHSSIKRIRNPFSSFGDENRRQLKEEKYSPLPAPMCLVQALGETIASEVFFSPCNSLTLFEDAGMQNKKSTMLM
jgi:hypothetical protein